MFIRNRLGLTESVETMRGHEQRLNMVSNNLANIDTSGYKKEDVTFWEMLTTRSGGQPRVGKAPRVVTDHGQGAAEPTGNALDFAIAGPGFFRVQTPQGVGYTRAGNFHRNEQGQLATANGHLVLGEGGPVMLPTGGVSVDQNGRVILDGQPIDRLAITDALPEDLEKEGYNLFRLREGGQEQPAIDSRVQQGYLEKSNVNPTTEMVEMIDLHRAYESQQKIISIIDSIDGQAIRSVGKLTSS